MKRGHYRLRGLHVFGLIAVRQVTSCRYDFPPLVAPSGLTRFAKGGAFRIADQPYQCSRFAISRTAAYPNTMAGPSVMPGPG